MLLEPAPPSHEGMHAFYTLEFTRSVWRVLREDGVFMQWLPLHFVTPEELRRHRRDLHARVPATAWPCARAAAT